MLEIHVFSNADVARHVFNAIAIFCQGDSFASMLSMAAMLGLMWTGIQYSLTPNLEHLKKWAAVYLLVPIFFITNKTDIEIIDATNPLGVYTVSNVPVGVALPASLLSSYMYGITQAVDEVFHSVDDEMYSKTGMLFGSKLYKISRQPKIQNSELRNEFAAYLRNCVYGDVIINHKYTFTDLVNAPDIWAFWSNIPQSPIRRTEVSNTNLTCKAAFPKLRKRFQQDVAGKLDKLHAYVFSYQKNSTSKSFNFNQSLQNSYQTYVGISRSASQIMQQNMAINAIQQGLQDNAARVNATAAALNYAQVQNSMQSTSMWAGMALQAAEYLPLMHSVLFLLFSCSIIIVLPLAMLPNMSVMVLSNYFKGFLHLGAWPILFAFLNFIMTTRLSLSTAGVSDLYHGFTLSNVDQLSALHSKYASMSGFLMMSIPFITHFIVKGGSSFMGSVSHQFANTMGGVATRTSSAIAAGDISQGNVQAGNYSYDNHHAHKTDTAQSSITHGSTIDNAFGDRVTSFENGTQVFNKGQAISSVGMDINSSRSQLESLSHASSVAQSASQKSISSLGQSVANTADQMYNFSHQDNQNLTYGSGTSERDAVSLNDARSTMNSVVSAYAKQHNISDTEANAKLFSMYAGGEMSGSIRSDKGMIGGAIGKLLGLQVGLSGSAGVKGSSDDTTTHSETDSESNRQSQSLQEQYNQAANSIKEHALSSQTSDSHGSNSSELESLGQSFRTTHDRAEQAISDYNRSQSLQETLSEAKQHILGAHENLMPEFQDYVRVRLGQAGNPVTLEDVMLANNPQMREMRLSYAGSFLADKFGQLDLSQQTQYVHPQTSADLVEQHQADADNLALSHEQKVRHFIAQKQGQKTQDVIAEENKAITQQSPLFQQDEYDAQKEKHQQMVVQEQAKVKPIT